VTGEMPNHGHGGITGTDNADHYHSWGGTTGFVSSDHSHGFGAYTDERGAHSHNQGTNPVQFYYRTGVNGGGDVSPGSGGDVHRSNYWTFPDGAHQHYVGGQTGGISANHNHSISGNTGSRSAFHQHSVTAEGGGGQHNNVSAIIAVNWQIKAH
jgi:hypothetical protein